MLYSKFFLAEKPQIPNFFQFATGFFNIRTSLNLQSALLLGTPYLWLVMETFWYISTYPT